MSGTPDGVVIGMDPHKRSATIEVMTGDEAVVGAGRFDTGRDGYAAMKTYGKQWPNRVWAIEGCQGIGRHIAIRLLADDEQIVDVPPKLPARARVLATGQGRKTDAADAHAVGGYPRRTTQRSTTAMRTPSGCSLWAVRSAYRAGIHSTVACRPESKCRRCGRRRVRCGR